MAMLNFECAVVDAAWPADLEEQEQLVRCIHCADWCRVRARTVVPNHRPYLGAVRVRGRLEECELHVYLRGPDRLWIARPVSENVLWLNVTLTSHKKALKATFNFAMSGEVIGSVYMPERTNAVQVHHLFWVGSRSTRKSRPLLPPQQQAPAAAPAARNGAAQVGGGDRGREGDWTTHLLVNLCCERTYRPHRIREWAYWCPTGTCQ